MSDFRRFVLAFALVALFLGVSANAQVACTTSMTPLSVRGDGLTELTGDIRLDCSGSTAVGQVVNLSVTTSTNQTSRFISDPWVEALLFINDPTGNNQKSCAAVNCGPFALGANAAADVIQTSGQGATAVNVFHAQRVNSNTITFFNVPLLGSVTGPNALRTYRIKNIRIATPAGQTTGTVTASIQVTSGAFVTLNNATGTIAVINPALTFARRNTDNSDALSAPSYPACISLNGNLASSNTTSTVYAAIARMRFREGYAASFKRRDGGVVNPASVGGDSESGFVATTVTAAGGGYTATANITSNYGLIGIADSGTRLRLFFSGVPTGVRIYAATAANVNTGTAGATAVNVLSDANGANSFVAQAYPTLPGSPALIATATGIGGVEVPISGGNGASTWEVTAASAGGNEDYVVAVWAAFTANAAGLGTATVSGSLAPISTSDVSAGVSVPVPRFREMSNTGNLFSVGTCASNLLFPYITTEAGFDSGIAISNTSTDPWASRKTEGACTLNLYGTTSGGGAVPGPFSTPTVPSGQTWRASLGMGGGVPSGGNLTAVMNFTGYIIAQCQFRGAHGYAFISDVGVRNVAHGYLALIITQPNENRGNQDPEALDN